MKTCPLTACSAPLRRGAALILTGTIAVLLAAPWARGATIAFDGGPTGTSAALDTPANWAGDALPDTGSEVLLNNSLITLPTQLTTTGTSLTWGSLIWNNNATSAITISSSNSTSRTITLTGGGGSTEAIAQGGAAGDLILLGSNATTNTLTIGGNAGGGTGRLNLILGASGNFNVVNSNATLNVTSVVSGAFGVTKTGAGTLTLSGANTFSGGLTIKNGTVLGGSTTALGTVGMTLGDTSGSNNASFLMNAAGTFANAISIASGSSANTLTLGTTANVTTTNTLSGTISLGHDLAVSLGNSSTLSLTGIISETGGPRAMTVNGGIGTVVINNATGNSFTGGLTLNSGRIQVGPTNALGTGPLTITGGTIDNISTSALATLNNSAYAWNGDFSFSGSFHLTLGTGAVTLGGNRTVTTNVITNSILTVNAAIGDEGNGYSLTKAGPGTLTLAGANTYSGPTIMTRGTFNLNAAASALANTSDVTVTGGTMNIGAATGTGVANRINSAAGLTLGGSGILSLTAGATGPVNSQSFASLTVAQGSGQLSTSALASAGTYAFTGTGGSVYSRNVGGTARINLGTNTSFTNAPSGSSAIGTGSSAILVGAVFGSTVTAASSTDFVRAAAGAITAPTYGVNSWGTGVNTDVTAPFTASGATQSLRFNGVSNHLITLTGTSTIESGGILLTSNAISGGTIADGTLQATSGKDLWIYTSTTAINPQGLTIHSLIADNGTSSLTKTGAGRLFLTNAGNTYAGGTYLGEGVLNIASDAVLGSGPLRFTGNATLQAGSASIDLGTRDITIASGQTATFDANAGTLTSAGVISGTGGLTKTGLGTLTLSAANTYTGATLIEGGKLKLDFSAPDAPTNNIISPSSLFSPGGGSFLVQGAFAQTVEIQGKDGVVNSQLFGGAYANVSSGNADTPGVYLGKGMTHLNLAAGAGGGLNVNLGTLSRGFSNDPNGVLDINIGPGVTVTAANAASTTPIGSWATVNGNTWAQFSGGNVVPYSAYSTSYSTGSAVLDVGTGGTLSANPHSLRFNNTNTAATVQPGTAVVRTVSSGGILVTSNVGPNNSTIASGNLTGFGARDLVIHQNNTAGDLQIDANIVDLSARTMSLSKNGAGKVILTANNTYTGITYVNEGTLVATGDAAASFTRTATSAVSSPTLNMSDTSGVFIGQAVTGPGLTTASITWTVVAIDPGVSVTLSNTANVLSTDGTFTFGGSGALGPSLNTHYIAPGATLQIGNGGATGSLSASQPVANNGTFVLNRSNDFTFTNAMSGIGNFEKQGAGNVTLSAANTFTGDTRIFGGSVILSTVATNLQSSTLDYGNYGGSISFGSLVAATLGGLEGNQNLALTNTSAAAVGLTVGVNHQDTTYSGSLSGAGSFAKTGGGTLTLSGANTYAGATSVNQGTLNLEGSYTNTGTIAATGGVLNLSGTFTDTGSLSVGVGSLVNLSGAYGRTVYGNNIGMTVSGGVLNVTGTLGTSAAIPTGQTAFSGNSVTNFSGTEFISGSSATFRIAEASPATVNVIGGTLTTGTASGGIVLGRSQPGASGFLNVSGGSFIVPGNTLIRIGAGFIDADSSGASALSISDSGLFNTGTTTGQFLLGSNLAGNTASTGTINLDGGTLATARTITGGTIGASIFNFNGGTFKANGGTASLAISITTANVRNGGAVIDTNGVGITIPKALTHSNILGDNATDGGLTKSNIGRLTLSGANTYTGPTRVTGGMLEVSGSLSGTLSVSVTEGTLLLSARGAVNSTAPITLGNSASSTSGTLTLDDSLTSTSDTLANPTASFGNLTLSYDSTLNFGAGSGDWIVFAGLGSHTPGTTLSILNWSGTPYTAGDTVSDRLIFSGSDISAFTSLYSQTDVSFDGVNGYAAIQFDGNYFEIVPIPEPSSTALLSGLGLLGVIGWRERRRWRKAGRR